MSAITNSCRSWLLTVPADTEQDGYSQDEVQEILSAYTYIGQLEQGEQINEDTGKHYLHWQIYIENPTPIQFKTLQSKFSKKAIHIERRQGTKKQAYDYVTKESTSQGVRIQNGEIDFESDKGKRSDLQNIQDDILSGMTENEVYKKYPVSSRYMAYVRKLREIYLEDTFGKSLRLNLKVIYIYGKSGVGKTRFVYDKFGYDNVYRINDYIHPFDNYLSQSVICFDEFRSQINIELMLTLLDIYPVQLPARFSNKWCCADKIYILSNLPLEKQYEVAPDWRGVYHTTYEQHEAFLRRISEVYEMFSDGLIPRPREPTYGSHVYDKVVDWQLHLETIENNEDLPF